MAKESKLEERNNWYQVMMGFHREGKVTYGPGEPAGEFVNSASDLSKHNNPGSVPRFRKCEAPPQATQAQAAPQDLPADNEAGKGSSDESKKGSDKDKK
jgi:hypothetical protein